MQVGGGEDYADLDLELCPICKTNYIQPDEIMCSNCLAEKNAAGDSDDHGEWEDYMQRDEEELDDANEEIGDMSSVKSYDDDDDLLDSDIDMNDDDDGLDFSDDLDEDENSDDDDEENDDDELDNFDLDEIDDADSYDDEDDDDED